MSSQTLKRILLSLLIGVAIGAALSEFTYFFLRETARAPKAIVLTIPAGTAEQVARGEQPPTLPENMIFVVGDLLIVKNEDAVDHQMGPLWIPAGASAHLQLSNEESLAYECSFQTSKYIGLDVREPLTFGTRLYGILFAGLPLGVLIAIYSFVMPPKKVYSANQSENT
ncbi:MAG: hypothetical protein HY867_13695 [Chloroflexi bacterium]|nr:hypothetical protein [Chloroflexota bacterium]